MRFSPEAVIVAACEEEFEEDLNAHDY